MVLAAMRPPLIAVGHQMAVYALLYFDFVANSLATASDIRLAGGMLHALMQAWAGKLGGPPREGSVLEIDFRASETFATERHPDPFSQSWAFAATLGSVATNHEAILRESLNAFANGQGTKPVTVVTTFARVVLETLAVQAWLIDPSVSTTDRFARWTSLDFESERNSWRIARPGVPHMDNPVARELLSDAIRLGLNVDQGASPRWIGTNVPTSTQLSGLLIQRYAIHTGRSAAEIASVGETFYRLFSGEMHGSVGSVLALLLPTELASASGAPVHTYDLSHNALWNAICLVLVSTFAARATYAEWLGIPVDSEARRLHLHHVELAVRKIAERV